MRESSPEMTRLETSIGPDNGAFSCDRFDQPIIRIGVGEGTALLREHVGPETQWSTANGASRVMTEIGFELRRLHGRSVGVFVDRFDWEKEGSQRAVNLSYTTDALVLVQAEAGSEARFRHLIVSPVLGLESSREELAATAGRLLECGGSVIWVDHADAGPRVREFPPEVLLASLETS